MKINKEYKIWEATGDNPHRPDLLDCHLDTGDGTNGRLYATDGAMAAIVPVEIEAGDVAGKVTAESLKAAHKLAKKEAKATIGCNGWLGLPNGTAFTRPSDNPSINVSKSLQETYAKAIVAPILGSIAFDVSLLRRLADALGTDFVCLTIPAGKNDPCIVLPCGKPVGPVGLLCRLTEK